MDELSDDPWIDDKFDRKENAQDLIAYIESINANGMMSGERKSLVVAVDADYGIGKTFFLRALVRQLKSEGCAVAYVDSWADDFINEPIVSIAATLRDAIEPWISNSDVRANWDETAKKVGKIAAIAGKGMAKQALKLAISGGSVAAIEAVIEGGDATDFDSVGDAIREGFDEAEENIAKELVAMSQNRYLDSRISQLKEARVAIHSLKSALSELSAILQKEGSGRPIFIVVDELDRCRPSYAIKMLEEIKHLFSVHGVVFILGLNSEQMSESICAEYGQGFDGRSYLKRFIDRTYRLPYPDMEKFVAFLFDKATAGGGKNICFPAMEGTGNGQKEMNSYQWLSALMRFYKLSPRDSFAFFEKLRTSLAILVSKDVHGPYLMELIAEELGGTKNSGERPWQFFLPAFMSDGAWMGGKQFFEETKGILELPFGEMRRRLNFNGNFEKGLSEFVFQNGADGPHQYKDILNRVARFGAPFEPVG